MHCKQVTGTSPNRGHDQSQIEQCDPETEQHDSHIEWRDPETEQHDSHMEWRDPKTEQHMQLSHAVYGWCDPRQSSMINHIPPACSLSG